MTGPDFLIIGAQRCGTTTLSSVLALHPKIFLAESDEEPKFFSREQEYAKGEEYYRKKYFSSSEGYRAIGEKSTEYMENLASAERIHAFNPDMKLICSLRDPVERAVSNYWFSVSNGLEKRTLNEALQSELNSCMQKPSRITRLYSTQPHAYISRGLYYDNLLPFFRLFPEKNIMCIIFEEFVRDLKRMCEMIYSFLGVEQIVLPKGERPPLRSVLRGEDLDPVLRETLKQFFYKKNAKLPELLGRDILHLWK